MQSKFELHKSSKRIDGLLQAGRGIQRNSYFDEDFIPSYLSLTL